MTIIAAIACPLLGLLVPVPAGGAAFELECTPLFEWCPSSHVVGVLRHKHDNLVLLALRHNISGQYLDARATLIYPTQTHSLIHSHAHT